MKIAASASALKVVNNILSSIPDHPVIADQQARLIDLVRDKGISYLDPLVSRWATQLYEPTTSISLS